MRPARAFRRRVGSVPSSGCLARRCSKRWASSSRTGGSSRSRARAASCGAGRRRSNSPQYARDAVDLDETAETEILHVGPVLASPRVSAALEIPDGTPVYERRRRTVSPSGPIDLISTYVPVEIAVGTDVTKPEPIAGSILDHIATRKSLRADYATERLTARQVEATEAGVLGVPADEAVLSVVITVHQSSGVPILTSLIVMPGSRHEIEDTYPLS